MCKSFKKRSFVRNCSIYDEVQFYLASCMFGVQLQKCILFLFLKLDLIGITELNLLR